MSLSTVDITVTATGDPCRISKREFFIYVLECCDFQVFTWCGTTYSGMKTTCGRLEIQLPPGCYIVGAVLNPDGIKPLGNHLTHIAVVRVNCGDNVCVTLFDSSLHVCATWLNDALTYVGGFEGGGRPPLAGNVVAAMRNARKALTELEAVLEPDRLAMVTRELAKPQRGVKAAVKAAKKR